MPALPPIPPPSRRCSSICSSMPTPRPRRRSHLISMPPMTRCTGSRASRNVAEGRVSPRSRFFHGYYDCYCCLPLYIFCGRHLLAAKLRRSNIDASAGAVEEVQRIAGRIRVRWPRVTIVLRADSAFAREALMLWCEQNRVDFVFGLARNARLETRVAAALQEARTMAEATGRPARVFRDFLWSTKQTWSRRRRVIAKAEWPRGEANPRFLV